MTTLGGILAEWIHKTPGKRLAGDDCNAKARPLPRASAGPLPGPHQPRLHCRPQAAIGNALTLFRVRSTA